MTKLIATIKADLTFGVQLDDMTGKLIVTDGWFDNRSGEDGATFTVTDANGLPWTGDPGIEDKVFTTIPGKGPIDVS